MKCSKFRMAYVPKISISEWYTYIRSTLLSFRPVLKGVPDKLDILFWKRNLTDKQKFKLPFIKNFICIHCFAIWTKQSGISRALWRLLHDPLSYDKWWHYQNKWSNQISRSKELWQRLCCDIKKELQQLQPSSGNTDIL